MLAEDAGSRSRPLDGEAERGDEETGARDPAWPEALGKDARNKASEHPGHVDQPQREDVDLDGDAALPVDPLQPRVHRGEGEEDDERRGTSS